MEVLLATVAKLSTVLVRSLYVGVVLCACSNGLASVPVDAPDALQYWGYSSDCTGPPIYASSIYRQFQKIYSCQRNEFGFYSYVSTDYSASYKCYNAPVPAIVYENAFSAYYNSA